LNSTPLIPDSIAELLQPYIGASRPDQLEAATSAPDWPQIYDQLALYLELILKWNARINLTAIRTPQEIVRRHFGESLFAGLHLGACNSLLDFGSGAGLPGIPIQVLRPDISVTLAESRTRKAAFLREVIRTLGLPTEVWADRVESMPPSCRFDTVTLRAVDQMDSAIHEAARRAEHRVLILSTLGTSHQLSAPLADDFRMPEPVPLPESHDGVLLIARRHMGIPSPAK